VHEKKMLEVHLGLSSYLFPVDGIHFDYLGAF
jgi:hypothetical protein